MTPPVTGTATAENVIHGVYCTVCATRPHVCVDFFQLTLQLETQTEEGHTALLIATRAGNVPTWKTVASRMSATEVSQRTALSPES